MSRSSKPTSDCYTGNLPAPEAEARMIPERDTGQPPHHRISKETNAKKEKIKKLESVKRDHKSGTIMCAFNTKFYHFQINFRREKCRNIQFKETHSRG